MHVDSKDDDVLDTNGEEEFEEQNPDDYTSAVSENKLIHLSTHII